MVASPYFFVNGSGAIARAGDVTHYNMLRKSLWIRGFWEFITARAVLSALPCSFIPVLVTVSLKQASDIGDAAVINSQIIRYEKTLVATARGGDRNAFGELVRRHSKRVY